VPPAARGKHRLAPARKLHQRGPELGRHQYHPRFALLAVDRGLPAVIARLQISPIQAADLADLQAAAFVVAEVAHALGVGQQAFEGMELGPHRLRGVVLLQLGPPKPAHPRGPPQPDPWR
jgi:hypothetical protein